MVVAVYMFCLVMVCVYGLHRYWLVYLYYRVRRKAPQPKACFLELPRVTVQLPMYNEQYVAERIIEAACRIDYPRDRLQFQVLDDSTDETTEIARATVERMVAAGHDVQLIHRDNRTGYKAGALAEGLASATGEFICIFDADFIPPPKVLLNTIQYFTDPTIGMVQTRWDHLNRDHSLLTRSQAILLDGHFVIEHAARNRSGRFMSFNGTAGLWRRTCIDDAGGWDHDTLTEDLDLSYRAQMKGWQFAFCSDLISPAELPPEMNAFKSQQHRWSKGGAQTAVKLLPRVLRSRLPMRIKVEAFFHLTAFTVYFYVVGLTVLLVPALYRICQYDNSIPRMIFDASVFIIATLGPSTFYLAGQYEIHHTWADKLKYLPFLMALGLGISFNNAWAALEGLLGRQSEFVRTPKYGVAAAGDAWKHRRRASSGGSLRPTIQPWIELAIGLYLLAMTVLCCAQLRTTMSVPFLAMFVGGYFYVSLGTLYGRWISAHQPALEADAVEADD